MKIQIAIPRFSFLLLVFMLSAWKCTKDPILPVGTTGIKTNNQDGDKRHNSEIPGDVTESDLNDPELIEQESETPEPDPKMDEHKDDKDNSNNPGGVDNEHVKPISTNVDSGTYPNNPDSNDVTTETNYKAITSLVGCSQLGAEGMKNDTLPPVSNKFLQDVQKQNKDNALSFRHKSHSFAGQQNLGNCNLNLQKISCSVTNLKNQSSNTNENINIKTGNQYQIFNKNPSNNKKTESSLTDQNANNNQEKKEKYDKNTASTLEKMKHCLHKKGVMGTVKGKIILSIRNSFRKKMSNEPEKSGPKQQISIPTASVPYNELSASSGTKTQYGTII